MTDVSCPGCSRPLDEPGVVVQQADLETVTVSITCGVCNTSFPVTVGPAGDDGVAVVG